MDIIIVDDDRVYLRTLSKIVDEMCEKEKIPCNISTLYQSYLLFEKEKYKHADVILLDIDMPEISGIEIASKINELKGKSDKPFIIFVTNRDGLVFDALREQPYSFVRKSYIEDLSACLIKIQEKMNTVDTYTIKAGREVDSLFIKDIIYLEKKGNYVFFHTESGDYRERTTIDLKLQDLYKYGFLRPQIGYLVNVTYISDIHDGTVTLINGIDLPLSKRYRKQVKQGFYDWMVSKR